MQIILKPRMNSSKKSRKIPGVRYKYSCLSPYMAQCRAIRGETSITGAPALGWTQKSELCDQHYGLFRGWWIDCFLSHLRWNWSQSIKTAKNWWVTHQSWTSKLQFCSQVPGRARDQKRFEISRTFSQADSWRSSPTQSQYTTILNGSCFFKWSNPGKN